MINDLTKIGFKNLNQPVKNSKLINNSTGYHSFSYNECMCPVLTGNAKDRLRKRYIKFEYENQCECCRKFYIKKPWHYTWGLCDACYNREWEEPLNKWHFKTVNRTDTILDLLNRCY